MKIKTKLKIRPFRYAYENYRIAGQVLKQGMQFPCRVRLFIKSNGQLFDEVASDEHGFYQFINLPLDRYYLVAHDPQGEYNAVIQDNVIPQ